jgi:bifunctional non-homologous end joining protein LigD
MNQEKNASLYFSSSSSDKEYHLQLKAKEGGFIVNYQNGRRGGTLAIGSKTSQSVPYEKALKIYESVLKEKLGKGYTPSETGAAYQDTPNEKRFTGVLPQLLKAVDKSDVPGLVQNASYLAQQKFDGERRMVHSLNGGQTVRGINKLGIEVALPEAIAKELNDLRITALLDGEIIASSLFVFDLLEYDGKNLREEQYSRRLDVLESLFSTHAKAFEGAGLRLVPTARTLDQKHDLYARVEGAGLEGIVFKKCDAAYMQGCDKSGAQLKYKFIDSATVIVEGINEGKRSVRIVAFDAAGQQHALGNVTIPPNQPIPRANDIIEVQYLYAHRGGSLFQPVYLGARSDQNLEACTISQLKYKAQQNDLVQSRAVTA